MKQAIILALTLVLASCGTRSGHFRIEGRFLNLNQGEFYVYSTDGAINGLDTIKVNGGRFAADIPCTQKGTLILIFPNFSEQPVFAQPGKSVDIKADASHLKQMKVTGTKDNELMTDFRQATAQAAPPDVIATAENFIRDNRKSPVAVYLLGRYFITDGDARQLKKARELLALLKEAQPQNSLLTRAAQSIRLLAANSAKGPLPSFRATDTNGKTVSNATLKGKPGIICTWASWNFESESQMRRLENIVRDNSLQMSVTGISLDGSKSDCKSCYDRNQFTFTSICDEDMFEGNTVNTLGMTKVPANIIYDKTGKIVARDVTVDELEKKLKELCL